MHRYLQILLAILLFALFAAFVLSKSNQGLSCQNQGGEWIEGSAEYGQKCILPFADGGKECTHSDQCEGRCVTEEEQNLGKVGYCEYNNETIGCKTEITNSRIVCIVDDY